ncbi:surface antigen [Micractinium conductrix]|uniref:Surface antigen n=1 Tax=Micractinium conductrix TaxID=554055 RepID=A0A2P6VMY8_9CHLO|nr:surface antigen [Micractinium conductrix]|eukprot:PSC75471.1 surface antigen [Micractinium conductrix]
MLQVKGGLPAEWSQGLRRLRSLAVATPPPGFIPPQLLAVTNLALGGSLPRAWIGGGLPKLIDMSLRFCGLTGTLPPQLFDRQVMLEAVQLDSNN